MRLIRDLSACPASARGAVVALGNFDGVHRGHQAILKECAAQAKALGVPSAVMTFEPHPREFLLKVPEKLRLCSLRQKIGQMRQCGIEFMFLARFNHAFASLSASAFVEQLLQRRLAVRHVVTGENFAFGHQREGTIDFLSRAGFGFTACPPVHDANGTLISSSAIRRCLSEGDMGQAATLLGRPYAIEGRVLRGAARGRALGFPTMNLSLARLFKPRYGIYAVRFHLAGDASWSDGVASLGINPTFGLASPLLEVHGFAMDRDAYGQRAEVSLVEFMREEKRFETTEALSAQIAEDCRSAKECLARKP